VDLLGIRTQFVRQSGRRDLIKTVTEEEVTNEFADNGADYYINAGQRMLDRLCTGREHRKRHIAQVDAGDFKVVCKQLRAVEEVWCANSTARWRLQMQPLSALREYYVKDWTEEERGSPIYCALADIQLSPELYSTDAEDFENEGGTPYHDYQDVEFGEDPTVYDGIVFIPPADETLTINIFGTFYSKWLTEDTDVTFWTVRHASTLVNAACWALEVSLRNTEGVNDWMNAILADVRGLKSDVIRQEVAASTGRINA
jgi:hypothetical protein